MRQLSLKAQAVRSYLATRPGPHRPAEVHAALGLSSPGFARYTLDRLVARGMARRLPGKPAQFEAVNPGPPSGGKAGPVRSGERLTVVTRRHINVTLAISCPV